MVFIACPETVQPSRLWFPSSHPDEQPAPFLPSPNKSQVLYQTKITTFFRPLRTVDNVQHPHPVTPVPPNPTPVLNNRFSRRSLIHQKLLKYNYDLTSQYRPIHSYPTMSPSLSTLYDSWGHSLPTIDPSKVFSCKIPMDCV